MEVKHLAYLTRENSSPQSTKRSKGTATPDGRAQFILLSAIGGGFNFQMAEIVSSHQNMESRTLQRIYAQLCIHERIPIR